MRIKLAHGGGGRETSDLLNSLIRRHLGNPILDRLEDGALLTTGPNTVFTTDSFVVKPLFFPGGDIGKLAVCGTANDLAVMGAVPEYLSLALILEEGFPLADLETVLKSIARECASLGVPVVCGDTKVVEKGGADGLFINTAGLGRLRPGTAPAIHSIQAGDVLIINGPVGDHGTAILAARKELHFQTDLASDCGLLFPLIDSLYKADCAIRAMRDATRGGLSAVVNEMAAACGLTALIEQNRVPIRPEVTSACSLLGLNPLDLANEGKVVIAAPASESGRILSVLKSQPLGHEAAVIGRFVEKERFPALLATPLGQTIILEMPRGELLPRIC